MDLLLRSQEIIVKEVGAFYTALADLLKYRSVGLLSVKPTYHGEACGLRQRYRNLTYFDSLHASVGIIEDLELVSYDKEYAKIRELNYARPNKYL